MNNNKLVFMHIIPSDVLQIYLFQECFVEEGEIHVDVNIVSINNIYKIIQYHKKQ